MGDDVEPFLHFALVMLPVEGTPVVCKWYVVRLTRKRLMPLAEAMWGFLEFNGSKFLPATQIWQFNR